MLMDICVSSLFTIVEIGNLKLKAPAQHQLVRVGLNGPMHTELINRQFGLVRTLNPVHFNEEALPMSYNPWDFYRRPNRELAQARIAVGCFSGSAVSSPSTSQRLEEPQLLRPLEQASADSREERMGTVVSKSPESDSASSDVSDSENDHQQTKVPRPVKGGIVFSRLVKGGWVNLDKISETAQAAPPSKKQPR